MNNCLECGKEIKSKFRDKYCSDRCQRKFRRSYSQVKRDIIKTKVE